MDHEHLESLYPDTSRFTEIEKIIHFVREGYSCQMVGMPGVGRSNICKFLCYNRTIRIKHLGNSQTSFHFVYVNFAEIKNRPLFDALKFIFLELVSSLHERRFEEAFIKTDTMFKDALSYQDELVLFQGLKRALDYLVHEKNLHIILLFERFEMYIPKLTDDFFVHLRSLRDMAKYKFSVVFSLSRPLEDVIEPIMMADFYEFFAGHTIYLDLADIPGINFRINYLEKLVKRNLNKKLIQYVLDLTGGHGKLTRLAIEAILALPKAPEKESELKEFLLKERTIQAALKEIWDYLTPFDKRCLQQICNNQVCDSSLFLTQIGLLREGKPTIPLLTSFLQTRENLKTQRITYDPHLNVIKKGETIISELLTSSEFKLLKYLIENPNRIIEREEVIRAVWKDLASTEGVTDQALDQLIFRLRKKFEDNPNQPIHLQTIKGRGIKFLSE